MKNVETVILTSWLVVIFMYQFHNPSNEKIKKFNHWGLVPSFHLFSPKPFLGLYIIRYTVLDIANAAKFTDDLIYIKADNVLHSNRRIIKCINSMCRYRPNGKLSISNYNLLLNYLTQALPPKHDQGDKIQFCILNSYNGIEKVLFKSRVHVL
ncbi:hypothetical protein SAMN04487890_10292 [Mucilaginibacter polytrichastri]|uniref:hypothetical protein n=1 Tax=Mucilaginibacter polytrichastri TaxID=1302689 RepID=UPI0008E67C77|nr:hypothetical protein [Mucilaginibacter polytrichastri]SFS59368.1 hypothetical protein SAMN04487890_10292 [Mucilaginibacter polytrichastri]